MFRFYGETELYVWELTNWHSSVQYGYYRDLLANLRRIAPPETHPRLLDYGAGIGTAARIMAKHGYRVTIADVPGKSLDFAKFRLQREGLRIETLPLTLTTPPSFGTFDLIVCFDVLEHVPRVEDVVSALNRSLRTGGYAAIVATFYDPVGQHPHHLAENIRKFGDNRVWGMFLEGHGLKVVHPHIYCKTNPIESMARRFRYRLWERTGYMLRSPVVKLNALERQRDE